MQNPLKYIFRLFRSILLKNWRFVRLSINHSGLIYFFDKQSRDLIKIDSRHHIDSLTADQIFTYHDYDLKFLARYQEIDDLYQSLLRSGKTPLIIDCGANIGLSALYFKRQFGKAKLVALEPQQDNFDLLKRNCSKINEIEFLQAAVGSDNGTAVFEDINCDSNAFRTVWSEDKDGAVSVIPISALINDCAEYIPFLIKIDIEGFEEDLFSRNTSWVGEFPMMIVETHDWMLPRRGVSRNLLGVLSRENRDFVFSGENIFSISNDLSVTRFIKEMD